MKFSFFVATTAAVGLSLVSVARGDEAPQEKPAPAAATKPQADQKKTVAEAPFLSPALAAKTFTVPADLEIVQVLAEPEVRQPLFVNWDERGRMWVVQYIQYPYPAGLKMVSRDEFWRAVYDKTPLPPPNHVRGRDKITIHEDTDGDGRYDRHKTFVDGLNIVSSCVKGRGGLWVLNPPYLLFFPDRDNDDVPDGDPEVHLQGFGMEDTHSIVNSLRFGPDGWLYAAQGSTVSGNVLRPGLDKQPVHSMGQLIWRYHPETRRYEIFAEGGGNAFGVEIDEKGRIFSGHNGGDTRGFHYVQGGYSQKGFTKHGPLSNPYAFGYFAPMAHHKVARFTHNFVIYAGDALPVAYNGQLFGIEPLQGRVVQSVVEADGSSYKTHDLGHPVQTTDKRFRPVEIKVGPDGAIYVADWYEPQISHREHFAGNIDNTNGRIYRLQQKGAAPHRPIDLGKLTTAELIDVLKHPNKWYRQAALKLFGDRKDPTVIPLLKHRLAAETGQPALEYLWALYQSGGFDEAFALSALEHEEPDVRLWTVRLLGDEKSVSSRVAETLTALAKREAYLQVRSQLASSARRLPAADGLPIIKALLAHDEDVDDVHLPLLLWWALESKAAADQDALLALFGDEALWNRPLVEKHILPRLMRRYAQAGTRQDLLICAKLFGLSPHEKFHQPLMQGFEEAFKGRSLAGLPPELSAALAKAGGGSLGLGVRQRKPEAIRQALEQIADAKTDQLKRLEYVQVFGEVDQPDCVPVLLALFHDAKEDSLRMAALTSLQRYQEEKIGAEVIAEYETLSADVRDVALTLLVSRTGWNRQLLLAVEGRAIEAQSIPLDVVRKMTIHRDETIAELVRKHWKGVKGASTAEMQQRIAHLSDVIKSGSADRYAGKKLYTQSCAKCHLLFGEGGRIGPDLTTFKRDDSVQILINVINPSAEVREGFETYLIVTEDGRTLSGFLYDQDNRVVVLRGADGQNITIERERIEEMIKQPKSLMPEGLLKGLSDQQVRDLFAYLRSSQPLNN